MLKKILIVDDHQLIREGVELMLDKIGKYEIFHATNGLEAKKLCQKNNYDLIIMDINMPIMNGVEAIELIIKNKKEQKILVLSMSNDVGIIKKVMKLGVKGYVFKDEGFDSFEIAVIKVINDEYYLNNKVSELLLDILKNKPLDKKELLFTKRELDIIKLIKEENTTSEISRKLDVSVRTIDMDRNKIMEKINVKNVVGIVLYAIKNNL